MKNIVLIFLTSFCSTLWGVDINTVNAKYSSDVTKIESIKIRPSNPMNIEYLPLEIDQAMYILTTNDFRWAICEGYSLPVGFDYSIDDDQLMYFDGCDGYSVITRICMDGGSIEFRVMIKYVYPLSEPMIVGTSMSFIVYGQDGKAIADFVRNEIFKKVKIRIAKMKDFKTVDELGLNRYYDEVLEYLYHPEKIKKGKNDIATDRYYPQ